MALCNAGLFVHAPWSGVAHGKVAVIIERTTGKVPDSLWQFLRQSPFGDVFSLVWWSVDLKLHALPLVLRVIKRKPTPAHGVSSAPPADRVSLACHTSRQGKCCPFFDDIVFGVSLEYHHDPSNPPLSLLCDHCPNPNSLRTPQASPLQYLGRKLPSS